MFKRHPGVDDFRNFLKGTSRSADASQIVRHLLGNCSACRAQLLETGWDSKRLERLVYLASSRLEEPPRVNGYNYDAAFAKADRALTAFFAPTQPSDISAEKLLDEIASLPHEEQLRLVSAGGRFANVHFVQYLIDCGHMARYQDPERLLHLTEVALRAAEACTGETSGGELRLADLRARAWGYYANSLRVCGQLKEAEEAFAQGTQECGKGTGDPLLRARLCEHKASLRIHQRRFEEAIELADAAGQIYREIGDSHSLATALIQKAHANVLAGQPEIAVDLINQAIPLIDCESDPHLLLAACHNLVRCYIDLARPEQALSIYAETQDLYQELSVPLIQLRAKWQEGQLLRDVGHLQQAEAKLLEAHKGFLDRGLTYEAAVLSLDLAALYLKMGSIQEVRQTATAAVPIFRSLGVDRDALASLLQLQQVADQEQQAMELIRFLNARIEPLARHGLAK
jgi:tetratricopeptide (TPR) repeat protein